MPSAPPRRAHNERGKRTVLHGKALALLAAFREKLAAVQILDPACGSGNFLYVALWLLLDLEKAVINLAATLGEPISLPLVSPAQLHGIEINAYAYESPRPRSGSVTSSGCTTTALDCRPSRSSSR